MRPQFEYGSEVRLIRNVRNDGTYPGREIGELLVKRGTVGCVYDVGTYLQDQLIYKVHFIEEAKTVGCREEELIPASEPWRANLYEFNDKVRNRIPLSLRGEVVVEAESRGIIMKVLRDGIAPIQYHVHFGNDRLLQVPESALSANEQWCQV